MTKRVPALPPTPDCPADDWPAADCPTPDYYTYPWAALASASLTASGTAALEWPDGTTLECHPMWLRENAPGSGGIDPVTRECELDPAQIDAHLSFGRIELDGGALDVTFEPEHRDARFHPGWLRHVVDQMHLPYAIIPAPLFCGLRPSTASRSRTTALPFLLDDRRARRSAQRCRSLWPRPPQRLQGGDLCGCRLGGVRDCRSSSRLRLARSHGSRVVSGPCATPTSD